MIVLTTCTVGVSSRVKLHVFEKLRRVFCKTRASARAVAELELDKVETDQYSDHDFDSRIAFKG